MNEKVYRIDGIHNSIDEDELIRMLPEVELILEDAIRSKTKETFLKACPDYFWIKPTSSTGKYHSEDEQGDFGNLLHTKRVFITYLMLSRSYLEQGLITEFERECGKSAALLHDMLKYGWPSDNNEHTQSNHDVIGSDVARVIGGTPPEVYDAIHAHNGAWADGKSPENDFEQILHLSDYVASTPVLGEPKVWNPSDELQQAFPSLPVISDDELEELL
jgi:hypothetical protein